MPWYAALGIPYAVMERRHAALFFTLFPVTTYLLNEYMTHPYPRLAAVVIIFGFALFAFANKGMPQVLRPEQIVAFFFFFSRPPVRPRDRPRRGSAHHYERGLSALLA